MNRRFALHYLEMVVVMFVGMQVLGLMISLVANVDSTAPMLVEMGVTMTASMVLWMRFRGHAWQRCLEMATSMILPTLGTLAVYGLGAVEGEGSLMGILHAVMLPAMLVAMLLRRDDYSAHRHATTQVATVTEAAAAAIADPTRSLGAQMVFDTGSAPDATAQAPTST